MTTYTTYDGDYSGDYQRVYRALYDNNLPPGITVDEIIKKSGVRRSNVFFLLYDMDEDGFAIYTNYKNGDQYLRLDV